MKTFAAIAALAGLVAAQTGTGAPVYTTSVVTAYTTYCPSATQLTYNGVTYTVTSATTLTITNCPCTITAPVPAPSSKVPKSKKPSGSASSYFPAVPSSSTTGTTGPATFTGAANKVQVAGAGLAALVGLAAAL